MQHIISKLYDVGIEIDTTGKKAYLSTKGCQTVNLVITL